MSMERSMAGPAAEPTPPGVMPGVGGSAPPGDDAHTREPVFGGDGTPRAAPSGGAPTQAMGHATQADGGATTALRLQILSSEHWSLLATRSLAWNESFTRAGMFLTALSGAIVALALVAQASDFGPGFVIFALVILPVVLFIGLTTYARLGAANSNEAICVIGMNRIRAAYLQFAPDLEPYFVMGAHDDARGVGVTMGVDPR
ncbi:MAG TPA: hypothetical protein VIV06_10940, partial [Candidatus Limnocylindrales bacterium]